MIFIILLLTKSFAATLDCHTYLNTRPEDHTQVQTILSQKVPVSRGPSFVSYVTEMQNSQFLLEVYLANHEARLYSQGFLNQNQEALSLSFWNREELIEITCRRNF